MEVWISKARRPVEHKVAMRTLTFVSRIRDMDVFSDLGLPKLSELYRARLEQARDKQAVQASESRDAEDK